MKNQDRLIQIDKFIVRRSIAKFGVWNGIVKYRMIITNSNNPIAEYKINMAHATLTNYATLNDPNLLEFYNLS